jgi:hypothetical protein
VASPSVEDLSGLTRSDASLVSAPDPFPYLHEFTTAESPHPEADDSWVTDLELMHQYTSSTYLTLPRGRELQNVWQVQVPKLALEYPFLLHQVLATSAYHLAFLNPEESRLYFMHASQHQNEAIIGLRTALSEISDESCHALFATSSLLSLCAFATFSDPKKSGGHRIIDNFHDVLILIRGMSSILDSYEDTLKSGSLSRLFRMSSNAPSPLLNAILDQLQYITISEEAGQKNADICNQAISATAIWINQAISKAQEPELRLCMSWPICLTEEFIGLMHQRHETAMTLLAYYGVVLQFCGVNYWYLRGWGSSIIQDVAHSLNPQRRDVIEWCENAIKNISVFKRVEDVNTDSFAQIR